MCGIAGIIDGTSAAADDLRQNVSRMARCLAHRGPDDMGVWIDAGSGVALGHTRLSILDLSPEGKQPMHSENSRYCIVFNGEIYSFRSLRRDLERHGYRFRGHSDTEVMLAAISNWGLRDALIRFNGMFAFALWDKQERELHLARDRFGEKPLYYGWSKGVFFFASELKALRAHPAFSSAVDRNALRRYLRFQYISAPHTIYEGIYKLPPGNTIAVHNAFDTATPEVWWSAGQTAEASRHRPFQGDYDEAAHELDALLRDSVAMRMEADVPLGAFLSGGIDSSTVVALMQAQSATAVKTFTIGTPDKLTDEAAFAKEIATHLGTDHTELYINPKDALGIIPMLPRLYDEPFADSSQIPTFLVSMLARRHVTVALSGDGGDELFGGYGRYFRALRVWNQIGWLHPRAGRAIDLIAKPCLSMSASGIVRRAGYKLDRTARLIAARSPQKVYEEFTSVWPDPPAVAAPTIERDYPRHMPFPGLMQTMMYLDTVTYLPEDILVKLDRASMGTSLETRVPLLDHRVFEFAWRLPLHMKVAGGKGKCILRRILSAYVPEKLFERPKTGFSVPIGQWLRGPLKEWAQDLLSDNRLKRDGYLNRALVRQCWDEHTSGRADWSDRIWTLLMFQAWLAAQ